MRYLHRFRFGHKFMPLGNKRRICEYFFDDCSICGVSEIVATTGTGPK